MARSTQHTGWLLINLLLFQVGVQAQLSAPITHDSHVDKASNKFLQRRAEHDDNPVQEDE